MLHVFQVAADCDLQENITDLQGLSPHAVNVTTNSGSKVHDRKFTTMEDFSQFSDHWIISQSDVVKILRPNLGAVGKF